MVLCRHIILGLLILQTYICAAPSNVTHLEEPIKQVKGQVDITKNEEPAQVTKIEEPIEVKYEEPKLDSQPLLIEESKNDDNSTQNNRQKRFYNFYGYGVPPINPVVYPTYNKRDQSADTGVYGLVENPLEHIQRRLQDITSFVRQPVPPPPPPLHFPFFFPVIYIPQFGCDCNSDSDNATPPPVPENPQTPAPQTPKPEQNQTTTDKRFPDLNDERQNWGLISNDSDSDYDENEFARPISFDPIKPSRPTMRPAPPVEHGSSQGNSADSPQTTTDRPRTTTRRAVSPPQVKPVPPIQDVPSTASQGRPSFPPGSGQPAPYPPSFVPSGARNEQPSTCDGAVLSCCHQAQITYDCFVVQGCPDPTSYGNPCDPIVISRVIEKFQRFYGVRNGK